MSNYTKGPWEVASAHCPYRVMQCNSGEGANVCFGKYICDTASNAKTRIPENAANARLIACAPEMAEMLLRLLEHKCCGLCEDCGEKAEALLIKAGVLDSPQGGSR